MMSTAMFDLGVLSDGGFRDSVMGASLATSIARQSFVTVRTRPRPLWLSLSS